MKLQHKACSDAYLRRIFSWLTRIGAAPKFGSRPISWYQMHQCKAIECLEFSIPDGSELKCKDGLILYREAAQWKPYMTAYSLFNMADKMTRS